MTEIDMIKNENIPAGTKFKDLTATQRMELIKAIIQETPTIDNLTIDQFKQAVSKRTENKIVNDLDRILNVKSIDYEKEKNIFLNNVSKTKSKSTKDGYYYSILELEKYCDLQQIETPLLLDPATADEWIYYLRNTATNKNGKPLAPATIRRNIAGTSSFFTYLSRRYSFIKNPFIGTSARPEKKAVTKAVYPTEKELKTLISFIKNKELKAIACFMAYRGLRCGAFQDLKIIKTETADGETFHFVTTTKGKTQRGSVPAICINALHESGIKTTAKEIKPFTCWTSEKVRNYFKYYSIKCYAPDNLIHPIDAPYSCHDLRHFYALQEYKKDKDIYRLKELLNHSSIATTEIYLRNLGIEI